MTSISPDRAARSSRIRPSSVAEAFDAGLEDRERVRRRMAALQDGHLGGDVDGLAVALVTLRGGVAFRGHALGLARLLEHAPALGQGGLGVGPPVVGAREGIPIALELGERHLALVDRGTGVLDGLLGHLEPAGVPVTAGAEVVERLVQLLAGAAGPPVGAADRRLETVPQGALVARQVAELEVVDRRGRAEEALRRDPRQLGHHLVGEGRVADRLALVLEQDRPLRSGERLLERADLAAVLVVHLELDGEDRAGLRWRVPRAERLELAGRARHPFRQGELECLLDGRLAGLVGSADDGQAGCKLDVEGAIAPEVAAADPAHPHRDTSWPASSRRPRRSASRCSAASAVGARRLQLRDARLEVADEGPGDRVRGRQRTLGQGRERRVADADLEEGRRERGLDLVEMQVELVGTDPDEARIEDEVRVRPRREQRDQGGLALDGGGVDLDLGEARPPDLVLLDRHLPPAGALVELHEEDLAGPVLVEGDRLGRSRVGVGDRAGAARPASSASGRARGSRDRWRRSRPW